jgi:hypothetical protein
VSGPRAGDSHGGLGAQRDVNVRLDEFAWQALEQESERLGVPIEDFISFAVLYYLADVDSGRIARRITHSPFPKGGS